MHTNKTMGSNVTTMNNSTMAYGYIITDLNICIAAYMHNNVFLDVGTVSNMNLFYITTKGCKRPNTTFIADITYYYDVNFMADDSLFSKLLVVQNGYSNITTEPTKTNYQFMGWSIDGTNIVNVSSYRITKNTTFIAVFKYLPLVTFNVDGQEYATMRANSSFKVDSPTEPTKDNKSFYYWSNDNGVTEINLSNATFSEDTVLEAVFTRGGIYDTNSNTLLYSWKYLIDNGADYTIKNIRGNDVFEYANYSLAEFIREVIKRKETREKIKDFKNKIGKIFGR